MAKIARKTQNLDEMFPDREFTKEELKRWAKAVELAGGDHKWLAKKGFITLDKHDRLKNVCICEGFTGKEVITGIGIRYKSDIPYSFWSQAFKQLDRYRYGIDKGDSENQKSLMELSETIGKNKAVEGLF